LYCSYSQFFVQSSYLSHIMSDVPLSRAVIANKQGAWKQGVLVKREKGIIRSTWKDRFVILFEGSLFWYQAASDLTPRGVVHLTNGKVEEVPEKKFKRKFCLSIQSGKEELVFSTTDDAEMKIWIAAIMESLSKPPSAPPSKEFKTKGRTNAVFLTGKIADMIVSMGVGGKVAREFLSDEAVVIIDSLKNFLTLKFGAEKANKMEKQAVSLSIKMALLYKDKKLNQQDIAAATAAIRLLVSKTIDGYEIAFTFSATEISDAIRDVQRALETIMRPVLAEKSMGKLSQLFDSFASEDLIEDFFEKKKWRECEIVATTLRELWDNGHF